MSHMSAKTKAFIATSVVWMVWLAVITFLQPDSKAAMYLALGGSPVLLCWAIYAYYNSSRYGQGKGSQADQSQGK